MDKKYQVFVSSTYEDLKTERQAAISCLLDMDCIPVGMEQFPASSLSQWEYIKKMVDMSDYYLLIVAGKYGSIYPEENISYTEKEYRYAVKKGMPILAFLHENIDQLPYNKAGATDKERDRVKKFHNDVKNAGRLVDFYSDIKDLKYKIAMAMPKIINDVPMSGWVRADQAEKAIDAMVKMNPKRIVMVSCNPSTSARDISYLCARGYELKKRRRLICSRERRRWSAWQR